MNVGTENVLFIYFNCPTIRTDYIPGNLAFPLHCYDLHCIGKANVSIVQFWYVILD
jgi:hypothetical protein